MNDFADRARWKKAFALADHFESLARRGSDFDADRPEHWAALIRTVESTSEEDWRKLAVTAGQHPPSPETQALVVSVLRGREQAAGEDPFARL